MAYDTVLHVWPSVTNCLAWSQDCELAVAADDHVKLLVSFSDPKETITTLISM
jgi:hypothetical protein